jgi:chromosome segregation ATPase
MIFKHYFSLPLCCLLFFCVMISAQESLSPPESGTLPVQYAKSEEEAAKLGPKNKAFMDAFTEYRELTKKLTALKVEFQDAKPERR